MMPQLNQQYPGAGQLGGGPIPGGGLAPTLNQPYNQNNMLMPQA